MRFLTRRDDNKFILLRDGTIEKIEWIYVVNWNPLRLGLRTEIDGKTLYRTYTGRGKTKSDSSEKDIIQISPINLWN